MGRNINLERRDSTDIFNTIKSIWHGLTQSWLCKSILSFVFAVLFSFHSKLLIAFAALVLIDLVSRWLALSFKFLTDVSASANPDIWECLTHIPAAHRAGYIKSSYMRHRFFSKMLSYIILVLGAALVDFVSRQLGHQDFLVVLVVGYLAATEAISIVENMRDAGVKEAEHLHDIVKDKSKL